MNDEQQAPSAIQGNAVLEALEALRNVGGTLFRSKHHGARQIRKKARLRKRLRKEGKTHFSSKLERKLVRRQGKAAA